MLQNLVTMLLSLFTKSERKPAQKLPKSDQEKLQKTSPEPLPKVTEIPIEVKQEAVQIDWTNPSSKISKYFTVKEALFLPSWNCYHNPSEQEKTNILLMAEQMDKIREFLQKPIRVHCWIRPVLNQPEHVRHGQDYNAFVKGARMSAHKTGEAVDWSIAGANCDELRKKLLPKLEQFDLRMEDLPGSNWVHTDRRKPNNNIRFFKP